MFEFFDGGAFRNVFTKMKWVDEYKEGAVNTIQEQNTLIILVEN